MALICLSIYLPIRVLAVHLTLCKVDYEFLGIILWNLTPLIRPSSGQAHRKLLATPPQCSLPVTQGKRSNPAQQKTAPLPVPCVTATVSCPPSQEATPWHARFAMAQAPPILDASQCGAQSSSQEASSRDVREVHGDGHQRQVGGDVLRARGCQWLLPWSPLVFQAPAPLPAPIGLPT